MFSLLKSSTSSNQFCKKIAVSLYPRYLFVAFSVFIFLWLSVSLSWSWFGTWIVPTESSSSSFWFLSLGPHVWQKFCTQIFIGEFFLPYRDFAQRRHRQAFVLRNRGCSCIGPPIWVINISACIRKIVVFFPHPTSELRLQAPHPRQVPSCWQREVGSVDRLEQPWEERGGERQRSRLITVG